MEGKECYLDLHNFKPRRLGLEHIQLSVYYVTDDEYNPYVDYGKVYQNTLNGYYMFYSENWMEWLIYKEYSRTSVEPAYAFLSSGITNPLQGDWRYGQYAISNGADDPTGNNDNNDPISNFVINTFIEN